MRTAATREDVRRHVLKSMALKERLVRMGRVKMIEGKLVEKKSRDEYVIDGKRYSLFSAVGKLLGEEHVIEKRHGDMKLGLRRPGSAHRSGDARGPYTEFNAFFRAYVTAALWSTNDESDERGGEPLDKNYSASDIARDTLRQMEADCAKFESTNAALLRKAYEHRGYDAGSAGIDFWLTRNGHGAGFWDRDLGAVGEALTKASKKFGEYWLLVGDDGKIHGSR